MITVPSVSISILNYQRRETLRQTLAYVLSQDYPDLEVIVVDNASTDGSDWMVEQEFPTVRLVKLTENLGCAARNAGVRIARGDLVVTIDNDVLLTGAKTIRAIAEGFNKHPRVACINFKILDREGNLSRRDWCHPRDWRKFADQEFLTDYVLEGASAFRRTAFLQVGGYWAPFFIGHEGEDLALRLVDAGYELLYAPWVGVIHLASLDARPSSRIYYTFMRNDIWVGLRNHRMSVLIGFLLKTLLLMGFSSVRAGHLRSYLRGIWDGIVGARAALAVRRPLSLQGYQRLRQIRMLQPSLIEKARRHWQERLI